MTPSSWGGCAPAGLRDGGRGDRQVRYGDRGLPESKAVILRVLHATTRVWVAEKLRTIGVGVLAWSKMSESLARRDDDVPSGEVWGHQLLGGNSLLQTTKIKAALGPSARLRLKTLSFAKENWIGQRHSRNHETQYRHALTSRPV